MKIEDIPENPLDYFKVWLEEARRTEPNDPTAVCLATADLRGRPTNRMVLMNGFDDRGFIFFTNEQSRKGANIIENPYAALCFHWKTLRKSVRVEGEIETITDAEADAYFNTRPRGSRIGAWASQQSRVLEKFSDLEDSVAQWTKKFEGQDIIPRPGYWKGYRVLPDRIEFWKDGEFRLHKRHVYVKEPRGWETFMLNP